MSQRTNPQFEIRGVNHIALTCEDMRRTVDFYSGLLGMPLIKTITLPRGMGQHFFFDIGNGGSLAFFWFRDAPPSQPGVTHPANLVGRGSFVTAHASMNHLAFNVPEDKLEEYRRKLEAAGVTCSPVLNHDDSEQQVSREITPSTFVRSIYFQDPDGFTLEFAAWTRELGEQDVSYQR